MMSGGGIRSVLGLPSTTACQPSCTIMYTSSCMVSVPVVHQVLIHIVGVEQRGGLEGFQQALGQRFDQRLGLAAHGDAFENRECWPSCHFSNRAVTD